jgi:glycerol-3-phosphate cytidylyltransferase
MKNDERVVGFTCSTFDLLHSGHIAMLKEAKEQCDWLIVGLLSDPTIDRAEIKNKPIQSLFERWMQLEAVKYVDQIIPFESEQDLYDMLLVLIISENIVSVHRN